MRENLSPGGKANLRTHARRKSVQICVQVLRARSVADRRGLVDDRADLAQRDRERREVVRRRPTRMSSMIPSERSSVARLPSIHASMRSSTVPGRGSPAGRRRSRGGAARTGRRAAPSGPSPASGPRAAARRRGRAASAAAAARRGGSAARRPRSIVALRRVGDLDDVPGREQRAEARDARGERAPGRRPPAAPRRARPTPRGRGRRGCRAAPRRAPARRPAEVGRRSRRCRAAGGGCRSSQRVERSMSLRASSSISVCSSAATTLSSASTSRQNAGISNTSRATAYARAISGRRRARSPPPSGTGTSTRPGRPCCSSRAWR